MKTEEEKIAEQIIEEISKAEPYVIFDWNEQEDKVMKDIIIPKLKTYHRQKMEEVCKWNYDEECDFYNTECDEAYCLIDGDLKDNKHNYCPFCGKKISLLTQEEI